MLKFKSAQQMLDTIKAQDLCNPKLGGYVFLYNEAASIAEYVLAKDNMRRIAREAAELGVEWLELLGPGGSIFDDPSYPDYEDYMISNLDWCEEHYMEDGWIACEDYGMEG